MADNRRLLTWTLNAGNTAYQDDIDRYGHKIYAIGIHEFTVKGDGSILDRRTQTDARYNWFPKAIEDDMCNWPHIKWYLSMTLFGTTDLFAMLDNTTNQDAFIANLNTIVSNYQTYHYNGEHSGKSLPVYGIEVDFEASLTDYPERDGDDVKYINVLKRIKNEVCTPNGLKLQVNAYAMWGAANPYYYRFHNYELFANETVGGNALLDSLQIMTYDFAWLGSAPGASTTIWWFEDVAEWAKQNFDPNKNPNTKLTIENVFFGCAGYGNRWPIFDPNDLNGRNVTYRNLLDWQNGLYRHNHKDVDHWVWHDQEFLYQNGFEDNISKNQTMYQHVYDFGSARHGTIKKYNGAPIAYRGAYNNKPYIMSYSRTQQPQFTGVLDVVTAPTTTNGKYASAGTITGVDVNGNSYDFTGYKTEPILHEPDELYTACVLENANDAKIEYTLNPSSSGTYRVIALVSFPWYTQKKLAGTLDGNPVTIGGDSLPDWYPLMFKSFHWYDMGNLSLSGTGSTLIIDGAQSEHGTLIYGFVVCNSFDHNFKGGEIKFPVNVQPFKKKDKTTATIPANLVITTELLRQESRPVILWEDLFAQFLNDPGAKDDLTVSTYYLRHGTYTKNGPTLQGVNCVADYVDGLSYGTWSVEKDEDGVACAVFDYTKATPEEGGSGQLMLNHLYNGNVQVDAEVTLEVGTTVGIRFGSAHPGDGYILQVNYDTQEIRLIYEQYPSYNEITRQPLSETVTRGNRLRLKAIMHNGKGYFYVGYGEKQVFIGGDVTHDGSVNTTTGEVTLSVSAGGGCGVYANDTITRVYRLTIATTDKWEPMEKFEVEIGGTTYSFGEIARPGYTVDEWGFINYSGINERNDTRNDTTPVPLDYQFFIQQVAGFTGAKTIKIRFLDPGIWFANLYVGDANGCSITYAGDAYSFLNLMNIAVNNYGAKGLGLWTMGQEDPQIFSMLPDVVPKP